MASNNKSGARTGSKTAFVLGLPADMSAKDAVAKGAAAGIAISEKYFYNIRSMHRGKSGQVRRGPGRPPKKGGPGRTRGRVGRRPAFGGDLESRLRAAIAELGLARSRAILDDVAAAFGG